MSISPTVEAEIVLRRAAEKIEKGWCQDDFATYKADDGRVRSVEIDDSRAECFCAVGAVERALLDCRLGDRQDAVKQVAYQLLGGVVVPLIAKGQGARGVLNRDAVFLFNDYADRKKAEVLDVFNKAIEAAKTQASKEPSDE